MLNINIELFHTYIIYSFIYEKNKFRVPVIFWRNYTRTLDVSLNLYQIVFVSMDVVYFETNYRMNWCTFLTHMKVKNKNIIFNSKVSYSIIFWISNSVPCESAADSLLRDRSWESILECKGQFHTYTCRVKPSQNCMDFA